MEGKLPKSADKADKWPEEATTRHSKGIDRPHPPAHDEHWQHSTKNLTHACVTSRLDYCNELHVLIGSAKHITNQLQRVPVQNRAARLIRLSGSHYNNSVRVPLAAYPRTNNVQVSCAGFESLKWHWPILPEGPTPTWWAKTRSQIRPQRSSTADLKPNGNIILWPT